MTELGVEYFRPVQETVRKINGRYVETFTPILGDYILTEVTKGWRTVNGLKGCFGWLLNSEDDYPAMVLPSEMAYLREMCPNGVIKRAAAQNHKFKYGDKVTPRSGALAERVGRYDSKTRRGDSALFFLFGREQRIIFRQGELQAA